MSATATPGTRSTTRHRRSPVNGAHKRKNGFVHVVSPASASEILRSLRITKTEMRNVRRALKKVGIEV